ncbi:hypothetical protein ACNQFZ_09655 [Schinkia sp. CFF1]
MLAPTPKPVTLVMGGSYLEDKISSKTNGFLRSKAYARYNFINKNVKDFKEQETAIKNRDYQQSKKLIEDLYNKNINELNN